MTFTSAVSSTFWPEGTLSSTGTCNVAVLVRRSRGQEERQTSQVLVLGHCGQRARAEFIECLNRTRLNPTVDVGFGHRGVELVVLCLLGQQHPVDAPMGVLIANRSFTPWTTASANGAIGPDRGPENPSVKVPVIFFFGLCRVGTVRRADLVGVR